WKTCGSTAKRGQRSPDVGGPGMKRLGCTLVAVGIAVALVSGGPAQAQKPGGTLHIAHRDSPASMSPLEEVTVSAVAPTMAVFNNLVVFDQHIPQNSLRSIVPDLASAWSWSGDGKELTFRLREGVRW